MSDYTSKKIKTITNVINMLKTINTKLKTNYTIQSIELKERFLSDVIIIICNIDQKLINDISEIIINTDQIYAFKISDSRLSMTFKIR